MVFPCLLTPSFLSPYTPSSHPSSAVARASFLNQSKHELPQPREIPNCRTAVWVELTRSVCCSMSQQGQLQFCYLVLAQHFPNFCYLGRIFFRLKLAVHFTLLYPERGSGKSSGSTVAVCKCLVSGPDTLGLGSGVHASL